MKAFNTKAIWLLLAGDLFAFILSLWTALLLRYLSIPSREAFFAHLAPFSLLFFIWALVFFISGLYDKQSLILRSKLPALLTQAQIANIIIATAFFYLVPWFGISPKTNLFLYLLISLAFILIWRVYGYHAVAPRTKEKAILIGSGKEMAELYAEMDGNRGYSLSFVSFIDTDTVQGSELERNIKETLEREGASVIAVDLHDERLSSILPSLYDLIFLKVRFIDAGGIYEDVFDREPLSIVRHSWFIKNVSTAPKLTYDVLKRIMDICISFILGLLSLIFYPIVALLIKLEDKGPVFVFQERIGKGNSRIRIAKFRSMSVPPQDVSGASKPQYVTRVGAFIRKTRIDELPQLWNVLKGDLSLIGPRPELPQFVSMYEEEIPFYGIRHLIKPGLSGWAQLYHKTPPKFAANTEDTQGKLSYDLYYVKNRSFLLDLVIALKTVKELVSRKGV